MQDEFLKKKQILLKSLERQQKHSLRRLDHCLQDLELSRRWEELFHEGELLQANFYRLKKGMREVAIMDWLSEESLTIPLDPLLAPQDHIKKVFRLSKKRKAAIPHLEKQVKQRQAQCLALENSLVAITGTEKEEDLPPPEAKKSVEKTAAKQLSRLLPYHEFFSEKGLAIRVGKNAKGNEKLTFHYANGSDWWFHVRDDPGSHVVLCVKKGQEPDSHSVQEAMLLALSYSKSPCKEEAEIVVTQCKHVKRLKNSSPGKVQIGSHKVMFIKQDKEKLRQIKSYSSSSTKR